MNNDLTQIKDVINKFQEGYLLRDISKIDAFMDLFCNEGVEVVGTNAYIKGQGEWCLDKSSLQKLVMEDWLNWGDLRLDTEQMNIHINGTTAWFATSGTVSMTISGEQNFQNFWHYLNLVTENQTERDSKQAIFDVLRRGVTTIANIEKGSDYVWPIRFSAILAREDKKWRFCQMTFSFPTIYSPDVRL